MKSFPIACVLFISLLSNSALAADQIVPNVVQVEGMSEMLSLLKRIDKGISRLAASRWEYLYVQRNRFDNDLPDRIAALGGEGWEMVNVTVQEGFIFKRRAMR